MSNGSAAGLEKFDLLNSTGAGTKLSSQSRSRKSIENLERTAATSSRASFLSSFQTSWPWEDTLSPWPPQPPAW
jgi:hypothetical protein